MATTLELFPTKIYKTTYPNIKSLKPLFAKLEKILKDTEDRNEPHMRDGTLCSYIVSKHLHHEFPEETKELVEFIEQAAREYWKICNYYEKATPKLLQLWCNKTPKGGWVDSHLHGPIPFTGVVYVDASPEQGNIIIENPLDMVIMAQPLADSDYPLGHEIAVNTGDVVLFPGYIRHRVKPNTTDRDRLILGFNIGSVGEYWTVQWNNA